jgi:hypothetical protein
MPDHKNFIGHRWKNVLSPRLARVLPIINIYSSAEQYVNRLLIFGRGAQNNPPPAVAKRLSKTDGLEDI